ncbi:Uncharacterised protein [Mycobacteroides abscessus subsp. abscessus]|nr:Uncharacterised protein [Mycobacteroides abscessus subsp. abscessus]
MLGEADRDERLEGDAERRGVDVDAEAADDPRGAQTLESQGHSRFGDPHLGGQRRARGAGIAPQGTEEAEIDVIEFDFLRHTSQSPIPFRRFCDEVGHDRRSVNIHCGWPQR